MSKARFTITTEDGPRTLFTVNERPNGDLVFDLKPPPFVRFPRWCDSSELQKYSVHRSLSTSARACHQRNAPSTKTGSPRTITTSVGPKQHNRFAPMFVRLYPDLRQLTVVGFATPPSWRRSSRALPTDFSFSNVRNPHIVHLGNSTTSTCFPPTTHQTVLPCVRGAMHLFLTLATSRERGHSPRLHIQPPNSWSEPKERQLERNSLMNGYDEAGRAQGPAEAGSSNHQSILSLCSSQEDRPSSLRPFTLKSIKLLRRGRRDTPESGSGT